MPYTSEYPIINVTADAIVQVDGHSLLLVRRGKDPFKGKLAMPGGFVDPEETTQAAAARELREETGLDLRPSMLSFWRLADTPGRDPRGPVISVVYKAVIESTEHDFSKIKPGDDADAVVLVDGHDLTPDDLAFDHWQIIFG